MTKENQHMTDEECDLLEKKVEAIGEILDNTPALVVLHAVMRIAADVGAQNKDTLTKREFVADCVECLDFWYDKWEREDE